MPSTSPRKGAVQVTGWGSLCWLSSREIGSNTAHDKLMR